MKNKLTNKILIPCVLAAFLLFCIAALFVSHRGSDYSELSVRIIRGGTVTHTIRIDSIDTFPLEVNCGTNIVCIQEDGVFMKSATCPDLLCVHQGAIDSAGESIVCLPNRIMVELKGKKSDVDAVSGGR